MASSMMRVPWLGVVALSFAVFGFSLTGIWVRWLAALDPLAVTAGRVAVALGVLVPAVLLSTAERTGAADHLRSPRIHLLAVRMTVFFAVAVAAFQVAPVSLVVLMIGVAPAWVLIFERLSGGAIQPRQVVGVGLALLGASVALVPAVVAAASGREGASMVALGALGGLAAGFFNASFVFGRSRLVAQGVRPGAFLLAAITSLWGLTLFGGAQITQLGALAPTTAFEWLSLVALGVLSTAAPLWGLGTSSQLLPPIVVAFAGPVLPFTAALAAWLLLGEVPPLAFALGAPFVVAGIALVVVPRAPVERRAD